MDKVFLERPSVNEVLRDKIRKYKKEHSRLSSNQIARRLGLPPSTFHRLEMGDVKNPGLDICVTVLNGLASKKDTAEFVREYFPEVHESLYGHFHENNELEKLDNNFEKYFEDRSTCKMMMFATTYNGLSESDILQEYGRKGHKVFMNLAAKGVLINKNGRFYYKEEMNFKMSTDIGLKVASIIHDDLYNEHRVNNNIDSCVYDFIYESVDLEKVKQEINEIVSEYTYKMKKILKNPDNRGNDICYMNNLFKKLN
ncbi:hypothetical protein [Halobacteriovorax sp. YZS-1-1]|uniref:hypothetical protein n=1 Tax=unclassified Halobacteriovorax TaxID=2639665 RepID=UPI00399954D5